MKTGLGASYCFRGDGKGEAVERTDGRPEWGGEMTMMRID
jgi:hypothetical protein